MSFADIFWLVVYIIAAYWLVMFLGGVALLAVAALVIMVRAWYDGRE